MSFVIFTPEGLQDISKVINLAGTTLYVNPHLLSDGEITALQTAGAAVHLLPSVIDPNNEQDLRSAIRFAAGQGTAPIWVEQRTRASLGTARPVAVRPSSPATPPQAYEALHHKLLKSAGSLAGVALRQVKKRATHKPLLIIPFLGYGNAHCVSLRGRVIADEGFTPQSPQDSAWRNLIELYKRLESDQVSGARVRARFQGIEKEAVTDRGGYFCFEIELPEPLVSSGWHTAELELIYPSIRGKTIQTAAQVLVPPSSARFGVISDIDDTILWTNVTNRLKMLFMLARTNAHTRKPFKGVAAFYRALHQGASGAEQNPIFYVSSSPWHLFPPLVEFMRVQGIPLGPLMLKELGLRKVFGSGRHHTHKLAKIEDILRHFPDMQFILIGDSGEKDPEIYAEVVRQYPQAVRAIYIRNVNPDPSRIEALDHLIEEVRAAGTHLILAPDSEFAAAHAAAEGLIQPASLASVRLDKREDELG